MPPCAGCGTTRPACGWIGPGSPWAATAPGVRWLPPVPCAPVTRAGPKLCFQLLVYPVTDSRMETVSMQKYTDSPMWNARLNRKMWALYLRDGDHGMSQYAAPMQAEDFSNLPPAYVEVEEFDCLHDEGITYARALEAAGGAVQLEDVMGTFHGFDFFEGKRISKDMVKKRANALRRAFCI